MEVYKDEVIYDDIFYYHVLQKIDYTLHQAVVSDIDYFTEMQEFNEYIHKTIYEAPRNTSKSEILKYFNKLLPFNNDKDSSYGHLLEDTSKQTLETIKRFVNNPQIIVNRVNSLRDMRLKNGPINNPKHIKFLELTKSFSIDSSNSDLIFKEFPISTLNVKIEKENLEKLHNIKNKFKFKYIAIESACSDGTISDWVEFLDNKLTNIFDELGVPYEMAGLNGKLGVALNPTHCQSMTHTEVGAYVDINLKNPTMCFAVRTKGLESLLIHEYTHLVDYFAGYTEANNKDSLSDKVLKNATVNLSNNNIVESDMLDILTYLIGGSTTDNYLDHQKKERYKLMESSKNHIESLMREIIPEFNLVHSVKVDTFVNDFLIACFYENHCFNSKTDTFIYKNILDYIIKDSNLPKPQEEKLFSNTQNIVIKLKDILKEESLKSLYSVSGDFFFFAKNEFATKPLILGYETEKKTNDYYQKMYATDPKELLARATEMALNKEVLNNDDHKHYNLKLSEKQKNFLKNNLFNLFQMTNKKFKFCKEFGKGKYKENNVPFFSEEVIQKKRKIA